MDTRQTNAPPVGGEAFKGAPGNGGARVAEYTADTTLTITIVESATDTDTGKRHDIRWPALAERLTKHDRRPGKDGRCYLPVIFDDGGRRVDADVAQVFALVLDIDKLADDAAVAAAVDRLRDLDLAAAVHTTHSDRADGKRALRGAIPLSRPVEGTRWREFYTAAASWLALPHEPKCSNPSRVWYLPSCPPDAEPESWILKGAPLDVDTILSYAEELAYQRAEDEVVRERVWSLPTFPDGRVSLEERARRYIDKMPPAIAGSGGHTATLKVALALVRGFGLDEGTALAVMRDFNTRCDPPWKERDLERKVREASQSTRVPHGYLLTETTAGSYSNGARNGTPPPRAGEADDTRSTGTAWLDRHGIVDLIRSRASEAWVSIGLGMSVIAEVRAGGIVTLAGPTGGGKTSLAVAIGSRFAHEQGWVVVLSLELSADEMGGREIGIATDASWGQVLRGEISDERMVEVLPERLVMTEWDGGTLDALDAKLTELRAAEPDAPLLFIIDYGQLLDGASDEQRVRVAGNWQRAKRVASRHRAVGLLLSQMSRNASRAARGGERVGADAVDGGAESAAIERWSSLVLEIGAACPEDQYGRREVQLSIAKDRMGGGDKVLPMSYEGRTGRWAVIGNPRPAADVKAEVKAQSKDKKVQTAALAVQKVADQATEPRSREELIDAAGVGHTTGRAAVVLLLDEGTLVEVDRRRPRSSAWLLWTPEKARAAGIPLRAAVDGE